MNWKKLLADVLKVICGALVGWLAGGCTSVPFFIF